MNAIGPAQAPLVLAKGAVVTVRVDDPGALLNAYEGATPGAHLSIGVVTDANFFKSASVVSRDSGGRTYQVLVPFGRTVRVVVASAFFQLSDSSGARIPSFGYSVPVLLATGQAGPAFGIKSPGRHFKSGSNLMAYSLFALSVPASCLFLLGTGACKCFAQSLVATPSMLSFTVVDDSGVLPPPQIIHVSSPNGSVPFAVAVPLRLDFGLQPGFLAVQPLDISVSLIPGVIFGYAPGGGGVPEVIGFGTLPEPSVGVAGVTVTFTLVAPPPPKVFAIVNAGSLLPGVSPGSIVSIFGQNLGAIVNSASVAKRLQDGSYRYPTSAGGTEVTFNGYPAAMLYAGPNQANAVIPYEVAGQPNVQMVLTHYNQSTDPVTVPLQDSSPAIFTVSQGGSGQASVLNQDNGVNGADRPAAGSTIQIFATGAGTWTRTDPNGQLVGPPYPTPILPVSVTIGGQPAQILYAGAAPGLVSGMLQVNAVIPVGTAAGPQPIVLTVGGSTNAGQTATVTVR